MPFGLSPPVHTPDFTSLDREQLITCLLESLQAKDLVVARAHHLIQEQNQLITALCDRLGGPGSLPLPEDIRAAVAHLRSGSH